MGTHEHPTQGSWTSSPSGQRRGKIAGLRVALIGDYRAQPRGALQHLGLTKLGASVTVGGPGDDDAPRRSERFGVKVARNVDEAIEGADVVNILRIQLERQRSTLYSSLREYAASTA